MTKRTASLVTSVALGCASAWLVASADAAPPRSSTRVAARSHAAAAPRAGATPKPTAPKPAAAKPAASKPTAAPATTSPPTSLQTSATTPPASPRTTPPTNGAGSGSSTPPTGAESPTSEPAEVTRYQFSGLDIDGELRTPALLQFLSRIGGEFETVGIPHRSFMPELSQTVTKDAL